MVAPGSHMERGQSLEVGLCWHLVGPCLWPPVTGTRSPWARCSRSTQVSWEVTRPFVTKLVILASQPVTMTAPSRPRPAHSKSVQTRGHALSGGGGRCFCHLPRAMIPRLCDAQKCTEPLRSHRVAVIRVGQASTCEGRHPATLHDRRHPPPTRGGWTRRSLQPRSGAARSKAQVEQEVGSATLPRRIWPEHRSGKGGTKGCAVTSVWSGWLLWHLWSEPAAGLLPVASRTSY